MLGALVRLTRLAKDLPRDQVGQPEETQLVAAGWVAPLLAAIGRILGGLGRGGKLPKGPGKPGAGKKLDEKLPPDLLPLPPRLDEEPEEERPQEPGPPETEEAESPEQEAPESAPNIKELNKAIEREAQRPGRLNPQEVPTQTVNDDFIARYKKEQGWKKGDEEPHSPYRPDAKTFDYEVGPKGEEFVLVYTDEEGQIRRWLVRKEDIAGLSPAEIKDLLALKEEPIFITDVNPPSGTRVRVGGVNPHPEWGGGNAMQFEILDDLDPRWFSNPRRIGE